MKNTEAYHLMELGIANNPTDPRRKMPPISPTDRAILDVGCGAGQTLIASHLAAGIVAAGVDVDRGALALGRKLDKAIHLACAKGEFLPFREESFDLVFSRVAVPYMNVPRALSEMFRVLKPGGRVWISLHPWSMTTRELVKSCKQLDVKGIVSRLMVMANGFSVMTFGKTLPLPFKNGGTESFQTRRGITRHLHRAGFEDVQFAQGESFTVSARKRINAG